MTELAIPESKELIKELPSRVLYQFERAGVLAKEILDERVTEWAEDGWTQQRMAEEMGCSQQAVSKRLSGLEIETKGTQGKGGGRKYNQVVPRVEDIEDIEIPEEDIFIEPQEEEEEAIELKCCHCAIHCPSSKYRRE
jgi:predicted transcriptional regulator